MKVEFTDKQRVYRNRYHVRTQLWDKLGDSIQLSNTILSLNNKFSVLIYLQ